MTSSILNLADIVVRTVLHQAQCGYSPPARDAALLNNPVVANEGHSDQRDEDGDPNCGEERQNPDWKAVASIDHPEQAYHGVQHADIPGDAPGPEDQEH